MKILLLVDMEGATGIDASKRSWFRCGSADWEQYGRDAITEDVLAVVRTCKEFGAEQVDICDCHDQGVSIRSEKIHQIDPHTRVWSQIANCPLSDGYDYAIMIGFHAMTQFEGIIPHSFRFDIERLVVNQKKVGEVEQFIGLLQEYHIKTILLTGDYHGVKEAENAVPGIVGAVVKIGTVNETHLLSRDEANQLLQEKTREALLKASKITAYKLQVPLNIQVGFKNPDYLFAFRKSLPSGMWIEDETICWTSNSYENFFERFFELLPLMNQELNRSVTMNQKFFSSIKEMYPDIDLKAEEIIQELREKNLLKAMIFYTQEERELYSQIIKKIVS